MLIEVYGVPHKDGDGQRNSYRKRIQKEISRIGLNGDGAEVMFPPGYTPISHRHVVVKVHVSELFDRGRYHAPLETAIWHGLKGNFTSVACHVIVGIFERAVSDALKPRPQKSRKRTSGRRLAQLAGSPSNGIYGVPTAH